MLNDAIADAYFKRGMEGVDHVLEAYFKSIYRVSISRSALDEMKRADVNEAVDFISSRCSKSLYLIHYIDFETDDFVLIFKKPDKKIKINKAAQKRDIKRDIEGAMTCT